MKHIAPRAHKIIECYDLLKYFSANNPIFFNITNTSTSSLIATMFGANANVWLPNFGNDPALVFKYGYPSYPGYGDLLFNTTGTAAYKIGRMRIQGSNPYNSQEVTQAMEYTRYSPVGVKEVTPIVSYVPLNQYIGDIGESNVEDLNIVIDGDSEISIFVLPLTEVLVYLYPSILMAIPLLAETGHPGLKIELQNIPMSPNRKTRTERVKVNLKNERSGDNKKTEAEADENNSFL